MEAKQPIPFKIQKSDRHAILVQVDEAAYFYNHLHYHPEIQITAIVKGEGIFYAGNAITTFAKGDVFSGAPKLHALVFTDKENKSIELIVEAMWPLEATKIAEAVLGMDHYAKEFGGSRVTWKLVDTEDAGNRVH